MKAGFIGLGNQGGAMARVILRAGHGLAVWARRPEVLTPLVEAGARATRSPAELGAQCDMIGVCVTTDADVREVVLDRGLLDAMPRGSLLAIHSTVAPKTCREIATLGAARGVVVVDAPVSGSAEAALARKLLVLVGGPPEAVEKARPVLESYGDPICHCGPVGSGQLAKLVNNLLCIANMKLAHDALALGSSLGLDQSLLRQALQAGSGRSFSLDAYGRLVTPATAAHVAVLFSKDIALAQDAVSSLGVDPGFLIRTAAALHDDLVHLAASAEAPSPTR